MLTIHMVCGIKIGINFLNKWLMWLVSNATLFSWDFAKLRFTVNWYFGGFLLIVWLKDTMISLDSCHFICWSAWVIIKRQIHFVYIFWSVVAFISWYLSMLKQTNYYNTFQIVSETYLLNEGVQHNGVG